MRHSEKVVFVNARGEKLEYLSPLNRARLMQGFIARYDDHKKCTYTYQGNELAGFRGLVQGGCAAFFEVIGPTRPSQQDSMIVGKRSEDFPIKAREAIRRCEEEVSMIHAHLKKSINPKILECSGSTLTSVIFDTREQEIIKIYARSLGDGTIHYIPENGVSKLIHTLDTPSDPKESKRVIKAGGILCRDDEGVIRVSKKGMGLGVAFTAGFGISVLGDIVRKTARVLCAEIPKRKIVKGKRFFLVACDGVHEHQLETVEQSHPEIRKKILENIDKSLYENGEQLMELVVKRSLDNASMFLIDIDQLPEGGVWEFAICDGNGQYGHLVAGEICKYMESFYEPYSFLSQYEQDLKHLTTRLYEISESLAGVFPALQEKAKEHEINLHQKIAEYKGNNDSISSEYFLKFESIIEKLEQDFKQIKKFNVQLESLDSRFETAKGLGNEKLFSPTVIAKENFQKALKELITCSSDAKVKLVQTRVDQYSKALEDFEVFCEAKLQKEKIVRLILQEFHRNIELDPAKFNHWYSYAYLYVFLWSNPKQQFDAVTAALKYFEDSHEAKPLTSKQFSVLLSGKLRDRLKPYQEIIKEKIATDKSMSCSL